MKHTPGPWRMHKTVTPGEFVKSVWVRSTDNGAICEIGPVAQEANARLIAAAPEMLEALDAIASACALQAVSPNQWHEFRSAIGETAARAIAKAKVQL